MSSTDIAKYTLLYRQLFTYIIFYFVLNDSFELSLAGAVLMHCCFECELKAASLIAFLYHFSVL